MPNAPSFTAISYSWRFHTVSQAAISTRPDSSTRVALSSMEISRISFVEGRSYGGQEIDNGAQELKDSDHAGAEAERIHGKQTRGLVLICKHLNSGTDAFHLTGQLIARIDRHRQLPLRNTTSNR
ncbi:hypothetical protein ASPZODRAFT_19607 [Penicilliopsis zonata CBS 506.65]|uniref:Uncharacterized protein n=1 Tax=Penicilliopsis zonata CBS 506.65 TaxID=1073090 RepID=A0A1L9S7R8_9EURO|nr:hypothetical protein ASPZODRAFT_19607 [Penicilliopsis zonata CBS 506.65]OJJ43203.1 hypothetical protein ASPZODRAFT_19607 [Penicilliopsis zonata CBS 506.65]